MVVVNRNHTHLCSCRQIIPQTFLEVKMNNYIIWMDGNVQGRYF